MSNADEKHFIFEMTDGKTLGFVKDEEVGYADVIFVWREGHGGDH